MKDNNNLRQEVLTQIVSLLVAVALVVGVVAFTAPAFGQSNSVRDRLVRSAARSVRWASRT
jgi:hypothetical protein